jgi:hypothetical protein
MFLCEDSLEEEWASRGVYWGLLLKRLRPSEEQESELHHRIQKSDGGERKGQRQESA